MSTVPLKYIAKINAGQSPPSAEVSNLSDDPPFLQGNAEFQQEHPLPRFQCRTAPKVAQIGDILLSVRAPVGALNVADRNYGVGRGLCAITPSDCDGRFLWWWLHSQRARLDAVSTGTTYRAVTAEDVGALPFSQLDIVEQRRIADFLDAETARIDTLSSLRKSQHASLDERGYAVVSEVLVPGILSSPAGAWPWVWLPEMSPDRPLVRLGYFCRLQTGLTVDGKREVTGDVVTRPYLRVANVQAGRVDLGNLSEITVPTEMASRATLRAGDVLMTEGGDLDKLGRGTVWHGEVSECLHQNHIFALRPERNSLDENYLALMTRTLHGRNYFESTGVKTTNLASTNSSKILSFPIPLPSVTEQRTLAKRAQTALNNVAAAGQLLNRQLEVLAERRQALITAAVTGQIDVSTASGRGIEE
ncbi:restriction endonuclease subunit S [Streptomyces sp. PSRA5]|uniref:restriction endonuclease subunit S n=1 Tax=Streptomyces panacea TaxID=3035064 RepID=UPI00339BA4C3